MSAQSIRSGPLGRGRSKQRSLALALRWGRASEQSKAQALRQDLAREQSMAWGLGSSRQHANAGPLACGEVLPPQE